MTSRKLEDCSVQMMACLCEFEAQLRGRGIPFVRACTYRSATTQAALYAQGRTTPGRIVTWAKPQQSRHNDTFCGAPASNAADYYPLLHGKLCDNKTPEELALWEEVGQIGEACGLTWGGRWPAKKRDMPHFEIKKGDTPCHTLPKL